MPIETIETEQWPGERYNASCDYCAHGELKVEALSKAEVVTRAQEAGWTFTKNPKTPGLLCRCSGCGS